MNGYASNNYDRTASYYDTLGALIFAGALWRSQRYFLPRIPAGARVLVAGGGTGKLLEELARLQPEGLCITYVEISENMLARARRRHTGKNRVEFIHGSFPEDVPKQRFNVIITPFLFDNFTEPDVRKGIDAIDRDLMPGGCWLFTDFAQPVRVWQRMVLRGMYAFFRRRARVQATVLVPPEPMIGERFVSEEEAFFYGKSIRSALYRKG